MTRTLTITADEWAAVRDGHLWIVRHGGCHNPCTLDMRETFDICSECSDAPADLLAAAAPCETCRDGRIDRRLYFGDDRPCVDCRITLFGECPTCADRAEWCGYGDGLPDDNPACSNGTITLGYAYPASDVLPIYSITHLGHQWPAFMAVGKHVLFAGAVDAPSYLTNDLAHYGAPDGLVGKWALQLAVQP